jgi:hypothetical protein
LYKDLIDGYYDHDDTGIITKYFRAIKLNKICVDETLMIPSPGTAEYATADADGSCIVPHIHIGFMVVSHVQWIDNGAIKSVEVVDKIYNWRR